jgi:uncharacterized protein
MAHSRPMPSAALQVIAMLLEHSFSTAVQASPRVLETAAMFGLGVDDSREIEVVPRCEIPLPHLRGGKGIVFITGPSGSGKSTILKLIAQQCGGARVIDFASLPPLPDVPLVDALGYEGMTLAEVMAVLSIVGLSDAFVMLRRPRELSDGQQYRLRLAQVVMAVIDQRSAVSEAAVVLADEFGSTLDRITAMTVARNIRRWMNRHAPAPLSFIAATAHDDLLEALEPEVLVWKGLGEEIEVVQKRGIGG